MAQVSAEDWEKAQERIRLLEKTVLALLNGTDFHLFYDRDQFSLYEAQSRLRAQVAENESEEED